MGCTWQSSCEAFRTVVPDQNHSSVPVYRGHFSLVSVYFLIVDF